MTPRKPTPATNRRPSDRELDVLTVLWQRGPSTVREVLDALDDSHAAGYTSLQKIMTIMLDKGLVEREAEGRVHRYAATVRREDIGRRLTGDLLERVFGGSVAALVQSALAARPTTEDEMAAVGALLAEADASEDEGDADAPEDQEGER